MPLVRVHRTLFPSTSELDWMITVTGTYACGSTVQRFDLSSASMPQGRWVILRSLGGITGWAGATVTPPVGMTASNVSRENVVYSGTTYDCVVVTLV